MYVEVSPVEIADGSDGAVGNRVTANPGMIASIEIRPCNRKSQLERHIETRSTRRNLDLTEFGKIMDRVSTAPDEIENALKPSLIAGDAMGSAGHEAMSGEANDVSLVKILEFTVVRDVEETGVGLNAQFWRSWHSCGVSIVKFLQPSLRLSASRSLFWPSLPRVTFSSPFSTIAKIRFLLAFDTPSSEANVVADFTGTILSGPLT